MARHQYDGLPYFCDVCGERFGDPDCREGDCKIEKAVVALQRAAKQRPTGSDNARFQRIAQDEK